MTPFVTPGQVAESVACGTDAERHGCRAERFIEVGFIGIALAPIDMQAQERLIAGAG